jgi:hypothetical protein
VKENECRAMSELSKKRVRTSLKAIAQFERACILSSSLSERCFHVKFLGAVYSKNTRNWTKNFIKASGPAYRSFAVRSGEINENTAKNPSTGPSVYPFTGPPRLKKFMFSAHRSFTGI